MPSRNIVKTYVDNGYYHIYNRGVEKRRIFLEPIDYTYFLHCIKEYLSPRDDIALREKISDPKTDSRTKDKIIKQLQRNSFAGEIELLAYCCMPNHFHLFIKQNHANAIHRFMQSLQTRYSMYFNRKYKRVGSLFQGVYKAVIIQYESYFIHLSKYIHRQAIALRGETLEPHPSSYPDYLGIQKTPWVHPEEILALFSKTIPKLSYEAFVKVPEDPDTLKSFMLEE